MTLVPCLRKNMMVVLSALFILLPGFTGDGLAADDGVQSSKLYSEYLPEGDGTQDLVVDSEVFVKPGKTYKYKNVNIFGGKLAFDDAAAGTETHFWAKSILVEKDGALMAGGEDYPFESTLVIHLYGSNEENRGIACKTTDGHNAYCGVPAGKWGHDGFFHYEALPDENLANAHEAFFGRKVLAVSYGGTLQLVGRKGMTKGTIADPAAVSGKSWTRLAGTSADSKSITLDRAVDWEKGDRIVITSTDFLPGHSEQGEIAGVSTSGGQSVIALTGGLSYRHNSSVYDLTPHHLSEDITHKKAIETRAAVALLTRNIRIVSGGRTVGEELPAENSPDTNRYFGGHAIIRQGFAKVQLQGVEFFRMGQGGMLARSPLQFHGVYDPPVDTFVRDCSLHDSMTRWIELRGAQNLLIERNVGYKSIGHGYMSAGYEANNTYRANIGIYARPAVVYPDNPRHVPGVYAKTVSEDPWKAPPGPDAPQGPPAWCSATDGKDMATQSDYVTPAVFLIANPYNTYEYNMAVGAGACGSCYWLVPGEAAQPPETAPADGYVSAMHPSTHAPLKSFKGNFCSTAQYSLLTIGGITTCGGITTNSRYEGCNDKANGSMQKFPLLVPVKNSIDHALPVNTASNYLPKLLTGDCAKGDTAGCTVTVIDGYTSSFHWGQQNWSAIWLRNNWFLFTDSALTDIMGPGLTMVSGGSYEQVINGYWALTRRTVFVGQTQEGNDFATAAGPRVDQASKTITGLKCEAKQGAYCLFSKEGISFPTDNFLNYQRFFNIYDGPVYQDSNAYLNIRAMKINWDDGGYIYGVKPVDANRSLGIPKAKEDGIYGGYKANDCILTHAAIGWKQPNGFYYPPAFHSTNLFFDRVDLRHFVLIPLFQSGEQKTDAGAVAEQYCTSTPVIFDSFTDVDRQTELNDDDGSMSGIKGNSDNGSISLNKDTFYHVPKMTYQCRSEQSCLQSPYDHVTLNIFPKCLSGSPDGDCPPCSSDPSQTPGCPWDLSCGDPGCTGIPLYRQYLNANESVPDRKQMIRMLGQGVGQRVNLVANHGKYFIETTMPSAASSGARLNNRQNDFEAGRTYYVYLLYANSDTRLTVQLYVGKDADETSLLKSVKMIRLGTPKTDGYVLIPPFQFAEQAKWLWDGPKYTPDSGILEVTMDMSLFAQDFIDGKKEACKPSSVCKWNENAQTCGCASDKATDIDYRCEDAVCRWSSKAMECPGKGCIGFQFTMPSKFVADGTSHRPAPDRFPASWNIDWKPFLVDQPAAGICHYSGDPPDPPR